MAEEQAEPKLDEPGAGLPWMERTLLNAGLRLYAALTPKRRVLASFAAHAEAATAQVEGLPASAARQRVLIARRPGIEDSTRFWSPFMVLEHMAIVAEGVAGLVLALEKGRDPGREVRIQDVKPSPEAGPESIQRLRGIVARYGRLIGGPDGLRGRATHPHPWFGPLDARQWLCLAAVHNGVHHRQLRAIVHALPRE
jgi:hypothetical protein